MTAWPGGPAMVMSSIAGWSKGCSIGRIPARWTRRPGRVVQPSPRAARAGGHRRRRRPVGPVPDLTLAGGLPPLDGRLRAPGPMDLVECHPGRIHLHAVVRGLFSPASREAVFRLLGGRTAALDAPPGRRRGGPAGHERDDDRPPVRVGPHGHRDRGQADRRRRGAHRRRRRARVDQPRAERAPQPLPHRRPDGDRSSSPTLYMPMLDTAEVVAKALQHRREAQDEYSLESQKRTAAGAGERQVRRRDRRRSPRTKAIVDKDTDAVTYEEVTLRKDEGNRADTTLEGLRQAQARARGRHDHRRQREPALRRRDRACVRHGAASSPSRGPRAARHLPRHGRGRLRARRDGHRPGLRRAEAPRAQRPRRWTTSASGS